MTPRAKSAASVRSDENAVDVERTVTIVAKSQVVTYVSR